MVIFPETTAVASFSGMRTENVPSAFLLILIPETCIVGAEVSATVGAGVGVGVGVGAAPPRVKVTCELVLLENPAKSNATSSKVYVPFLNPVHVIVTCLVSVIDFVFPCAYSNVPTCCLLRRTNTLLIFLGPVTVYDILNGEVIALATVRFTLILVSGLSSVP